MPIVGGMDIHRKQITFDDVDLATGEGGVRSDRAGPDRRHLRAWLERFEGIPDAGVRVGGCTGWRYVAAELARAGVQAHLAEPADTAAARGRKKRAKTDRADSRLMRDLLLQGRSPEMLDPAGARPGVPGAAGDLSCAAARAHRMGPAGARSAVPPGRDAAARGRDRDRRGAGAAARDRRRAAVACAGQQQIGLYLRMLEVTEAELDALRGQLTGAARRLAGAKALREQLYGVGPAIRERAT